MKISTLFDAYKIQLLSTPVADSIFSESGMTTDSAKLKFGFFPLGSGILTDHSQLEQAEIVEGGAMVLGHDFGTVFYVKNKCKDGRENNSKTIKNLQDIGLNIETTFFTNFYLGLRDDNTHTDMKMTKLTVKRTKQYNEFCHAFFLTQLKLINPKLVLCLGKEVGKILPDIFKSMTNEGKSIFSLYSGESADYIVTSNDGIYGRRKFILIPHPSYAHINWSKNNIKDKIKEAIKN
jgi:hypothetical protein